MREKGNDTVRYKSDNDFVNRFQIANLLSKAFPVANYSRNTFEKKPPEYPHCTINMLKIHGIYDDNNNYKWENFYNSP